LARPKLQHYVTRAYLEGFLGEDEKLLFCYGRGFELFKKQPADLAAQRNYYAIKNPDGTWDDRLENAIGHSVESPGLPVVKKLASGKTRLNWDDRKKIAMLIAFQEARTPAARARVRESLSAMQERMLGEVWGANPGQKSVDLVGENGKSVTVTLEEMIASHNELATNDHCFEIHRLMMGHAFRLATIFERMKFTIHYAAVGEFITTDTPVVRVFTGGDPLGYGVQRQDIEIRFPLSRRAFLTLTHDLKLIEIIEKADQRKRERLLAATPEVQVRSASNAEVRAFNRGHVRHAHRWIFAAHELDWAAELLAQPSVAPKVLDLSTRDLMHFQSVVTYDPRIDQVE
jgi:Protein of unknown function (DUF4238)